MFSESIFSKTHSLIWSKESHKLRSFNCFNLSYSVNIKMSPCFIEIFLEVWLEFSTFKSFMSSKNFSCGCLSKGFVKPEFSSWFSPSVFFKSIVGKNWSNENIISVLRKVLWKNSDIWAVVSFARVSDCEPSIELHVFFIRDWALRIRRIRILFLILLSLFLSLLSKSLSLYLSWWSVGWSCIGFGDWVFSVCFLNLGISSVIFYRL